MGHCEWWGLHIQFFLVSKYHRLHDFQAREPYMTICQISTIDGSAKLERQVTKITAQMKHQCPTVEAAGYFRLGRNMILKVSFSLIKIDLYLMQHISEQNLFQFCTQDIHLHIVQKQLLALLITLPRNELLYQVWGSLGSNGFHMK